MSRYYIILALLLSHLATVAQIAQERIHADLDQQGYVVGEHIRLNVHVDLPDGTPSPSRVAYVEIADTAQLYAQAMVALDDGTGYAEISLPKNMHSGTYQLCIYTRGLRNFGESAFYTTQIGVINPVRLSSADNIRFLPSDDDTVTIMLDPVTNRGTIIDIPPTEYPYTYEVEGHIVTAHIDANADDIDIVRLALVGKTTMIYDGRKTKDGKYEFYTTGIYGEQPSLVSAYSADGKSLKTELLSPYAQVLPSHLPQLTVRCSEEALRQRYADALRQEAVDTWQHKEPQYRSDTFMTSTPQYVYDLDEWACMDTVGEMLTEFIRGIHVRRTNGVPQLYTYSQSPALVLFDGIPIYDVQKFLEYDPRNLKYVQIYDDRYTFGHTYCYGVVSFISRSGKLPNFTLDEGTTFASYQFPQQNHSSK